MHGVLMAACSRAELREPVTERERHELLCHGLRLINAK